MRLPGRRDRLQRSGALLSLILLVLFAALVSPLVRRRQTDPSIILPGYVRADLASTASIGRTNPEHHINLTIALQPRSPTTFQAAVANVETALVVHSQSSSEPVDRSVVGQPADRINALREYLQSYGLDVERTPANGLSLSARGTIDQVERAFSTSFGNFRTADGEPYFAVTRDPSLPANLAPFVLAIFGLDNYPALRAMHVGPDRNPPSAGVRSFASTPGAYTPADIDAAYDLGTLHDIGLNGSGQTIGIVGCSAYSLSDVDAFAAQYRLPTPVVTPITVDGGGASPDAETTLDLEWSHAAAPAAALRVYSTANSGSGCTYLAFYDAINQAVTENIANVISISIGACEADYDGYILAIDTVLKNATLNNQEVLVASGDNGAYACVNSSNQPTVGVNYPASSAYVTAVGGTNLTVKANGTYGSETAWGTTSESCGIGSCGSGGGSSSIFPEPVWQSSASANTTSFRGVPDVALNADPAIGYNVYYGGSLQSGYGGTSFGAPIWAGLAALADQAAGSRLSFLSPILYGPTVTGAQSGAFPPFHDVITGNNLLYDAAPGWDFATGWGSPDGYNLVRALAPTIDSTPTATQTVTPTPTQTGTPTRTPTVTPTPTPTPRPTSDAVQINLPDILLGSSDTLTSTPTP